VIAEQDDLHRGARKAKRRPAATEPEMPKTVETKIEGATAPKPAQRTGKRARSV
jgi:hypothetical protein